MEADIPQRSCVHWVPRGTNHQCPSRSNFVDDAAAQNTRRAEQAVENDVGLVDDANQLRLLASCAEARDGEIRAGIAEEDKTHDDGLDIGPKRGGQRVSGMKKQLLEGRSNARIVSPCGQTLVLRLRLCNGNLVFCTVHGW